jgi:hypothetical protein
MILFVANGVVDRGTGLMVEHAVTRHQSTRNSSLINETTDQCRSGGGSVSGGGGINGGGWMLVRS